MTSEIVKGSEIIIRKASRPNRQGGYVDYKDMLPAEEERAKVLKITKTKRGRKAHVRGELYRFAIMLDDLPDFMTVEVVQSRNL